MTPLFIADQIADIETLMRTPRALKRPALMRDLQLDLAYYKGLLGEAVGR